MAYAETDNMKAAENKLLKFKPEHNVHEISNAQEKKGYVYAIKGSKRQ